MNADTARAVLAQAKKDETYEGPIPEDDSKAVSEAEGLVEMAQAAWDQYVRGPEVEALLRIAASDTNGSVEAPPAPAETETEPEPETAPAGAPPGGGKQPPAPPATGDPESSVAEDLSNVEPWEGYAADKVGDITSAIEAAVKEYEEGELRDLLANIWAFESTHKKRNAVIGKLEQVAAQLNPSEPEPEPEPEPAPEPEPEPEVVQDPPPVETKRARPGTKAAAQAPPPEPPPEEPKAEEPAPEPEPAETQAETRGNVFLNANASTEKTGDEDYDNLMATVESELARERAHVPKPPTEEVQDLPWDWTRLSDKELQNFYGVYSAIAYYKGYILAREERLANHCRAAADELHRTLLVASDKHDETGKPKTMTILEAEVEDDENVKLWRRRQRKHETFASAHRQERDSLNKLVESLSRLETMRHNEWERSGGKVGRSRS